MILIWNSFKEIWLFIWKCQRFIKINIIDNLSWITLTYRVFIWVWLCCLCLDASNMCQYAEGTVVVRSIKSSVLKRGKTAESSIHRGPNKDPTPQYRYRVMTEGDSRTWFLNTFYCCHPTSHTTFFDCSSSAERINKTLSTSPKKIHKTSYVSWLSLCK